MDTKFAFHVIASEALAVESLANTLSDDSLQKAGELALLCRGRIITTGVGKAGIIATKIAATFSSTGTPSHFLHPVEAKHGDLGVLTSDDVVLALSNSGETEELLSLLPHIKEMKCALIAITGFPTSRLGTYADVVLSIGDIQEACPLGLAPSASSTAMLAVGDALALMVLNARNLSAKDFARYHPGGSLGRQLQTVKEVMRSGSRCPQISKTATLLEAANAITKAKAGSVLIVENKKLIGIITDGDIRRHLNKLDEKVETVMTNLPYAVCEDELSASALAILRENKIDEVPVLDKNGALVGIVDVQDLLEVVGFSV